MALLAGCIPAGASAPVVPQPEKQSVPLRIVSLNPCSDAVLAEVADRNQLLAVSHYSHDPQASSMDVAEARRFPATSGSVEEILQFRPDVVVSGTYISPATLAALRRLGIRVELLPIAATVAESEAQVRTLAQLAGHPERGEALVAKIHAALDAARPPAGSTAVSALVWQSGGMVPGGDTLIADLLHRTGFISFAAAKGMKQAEILPLEELLADPPQVILTAGDVHGEEDRMLAHPALRHLSQSQRQRLEPSLLYCGGPTIIRAAQRLAQIRRNWAARP